MTKDANGVEIIEDEELKPGATPEEFEGLGDLLDFHNEVKAEVNMETEDGKIEVKEEVVLPNDPEFEKNKPETNIDNEQNNKTNPTELDELKATIEAMRAEIIRLSTSTTSIEKEDKTEIPPESDKETKTEIKTQVQQVWPVKEFDIKDIISDEELDQMLDKPEVVREALNRVRLATLQEAQSVLPNVIRQEVNRQVTISKLVTDFYDQNRDLIPFAEFVSNIMTQEEAKNQTKTYKEIFELVATESRKRLGLKAPVVDDKGKTMENAPAFAGSRRSNRRPDSTDSTKGTSELADMMSMKDLI